jgi:uncharacterized protein (DUF362 family)
MSRTIDRREFLKRLSRTSGVLLAASAGALYFHDKARATGPVAKLKDHRKGLFVPERMVVVRGRGIEEMILKGFEAMGGPGAFIKSGERILIKPNMAWDRAPEQGANTNPLVIAAVVKVALAAGAKEVVVADIPCNDPGKVMERSGIRDAALKAGAHRVVVPQSGEEVQFGGKVLAGFMVGKEFLEADRIINVPIVKTHSLAGMSCCIKNWYGLLLGRRHELHQNIGESLADLAAAARPTLTIIDATHILIRNGPTGGSLSDVVTGDSIAFTTDEVAGDAWAAGLLGRQARDFPFIGLAAARGAGRSDYKAILKEEIAVGA